MQWSPRNRTGDEEDDKSLDSETENPQSDNNNNNSNNNNNNNINNNNNNKELRKDKRDDSVDKNHIDEDETIVVDNIIGEDILMSISDRRKANNSTMTRGSGNDVTSYLACSSLSSNKHSSVAPDNHRTPSSRFQPFADPHQVRVQPSATQHQKKFSQPLSMPACGNIGLSLTSSLSSSSSSSSSASSSLSSSFHSPSPLPPYNIFSQPPGGSNFYPHPSFMHGFAPSYCASGSGVFSSSREYNSNSGRSLFSHSYKPLTPCGTTDSSSDSSQPFLNLSVTQLPGMMPSSIEGVSKPRIWSLADVATSVVDESPAAVAAVVAPTYSASDSMFGQQQQQHFAPPNSYFSISSRTTSDDQDKKTAAASLPFKGHDDGKNESLEDEYENIVMNSVDRRQNQEKSLKNQLLNPTGEDRYQQFSSCGGPYSNSYNFPFPERTFQRRQDYNVVNCSSSSSSSSSFSLFPGSFFGNANSDMLQTVHGSSPTYFHATAYNDNTSLERQYREEKNKSKISIT